MNEYHFKDANNNTHVVIAPSRNQARKRIKAIAPGQRFKLAHEEPHRPPKPDAAAEHERRIRSMGARRAPSVKKVGPNKPCPCGSGKKYKWCHMRPVS